MAQFDAYDCGATDVEPMLHGTCLLSVSAGDTIGISLRQSSGAGQVLSGVATSNWMYVLRVSP